MIKDTLLNVLYGVWPMLIIFTVILTSVRIAFLLGKHQKIVLYKELFMLAFVIYILMLFYIVTFHDDSKIGTTNFVPFKEIFRYQFGSHLFFKNIVGNLLLFVPFGIFIPFYINSRKLSPVLLLAIISSLAIEITQSKIGRVFDIDDIILNVVGGMIGYIIYRFLDSIKGHVPRFLKKDWIMNIIVIVILILIILYFLNFDTAFLKYLS